MSVAFSPMQLALYVESDTSTALNGWHRGELALQEKMDSRDAVSEDWKMIHKTLPMQHRLFYTELHFLPLTTVDDRGRPWISLLVGPSGEPGFISSPNNATLQIVSITWEGDPIRRNLKNQTNPADSQMVAGVGVMTSNRRRNKLAGETRAVGFMDNFLALQIGITEALGNCPKYIPIREFDVCPTAMPTLDSRNQSMSDSDTLPPAVIEFIAKRDMLFLGSRHETHLGANIRGGPVGFVRVRKDKRTLVTPDYSGNRMMQSLGNIWETKQAGLVFPDFESGDILYVTGDAEVLFGDEAKLVMPRAPRVLQLRVTGYSFVRNAIPFRTRPGSLEPSPYTPPVRYLAEEDQLDAVSDTTADLESVVLHSPDLATFRFKLSKPVKHVAGQYGIFDMMPFIGDLGYAHMKSGDEKFVNEDGIRTWTLSSSPTAKDKNESNQVAITIRRVHRGRVTTKLFSYAQNRLAVQDVEDESKRFNLSVPFLGTGGTFVLPQSPQKLLFIAGGVGLTPFLSMMSSFSSRDQAAQQGWDIELWVSTREPAHIEALVSDRGRQAPARTTLFTRNDHVSSSTTVEKVRINEWVLSDAFDSRRVDGRKIYICGPPQFENDVLSALEKRSVNTTDVTRESFAY